MPPPGRPRSPSRERRHKRPRDQPAGHAPAEQHRADRHHNRVREEQQGDRGRGALPERGEEEPGLHGVAKDPQRHELRPLRSWRAHRLARHGQHHEQEDRRDPEPHREDARHVEPGNRRGSGPSRLPRRTPHWPRRAYAPPMRSSRRAMTGDATDHGRERGPVRDSPAGQARRGRGSHAVRDPAADPIVGASPHRSSGAGAPDQAGPRAGPPAVGRRRARGPAARGAPGRPGPDRRGTRREWVASFDAWDICDVACGNLFDRRRGRGTRRWSGADASPSSRSAPASR